MSLSPISSIAKAVIHAAVLCAACGACNSHREERAARDHTRTASPDVATDCSAIFDAEVKCGSGGGSAMDRDAWIAFCADPKVQNMDGFAESVACANEPSCDAMKACRGRADGARQTEPVRKALANGDYEQAWYQCTFRVEPYANATFAAECANVFDAAPAKLAAQDLKGVEYTCRTRNAVERVSPAFANACATIESRRLAGLMAAATMARDAGVRADQACLELERASGAAGSDAAANAKTVCAEANASAEVTAALAESKRLVFNRRYIPSRCATTPDQLAAIGTPWATQKRTELLSVCYGELGPIIIEDARKNRNTDLVCPTDVKRLKEAFVKYDLAATFPTLATLMKKLPGACGR